MLASAMLRSSLSAKLSKYTTHYVFSRGSNIAQGHKAMLRPYSYSAKLELYITTSCLGWLPRIVAEVEISHGQKTEI